MSVCWYYMQGRCRFGDRCRNVHPAAEDDFDDEYEEAAIPRGASVGGFDFNAALRNVRRQEQAKQYRSESFQRRYSGTYHSPQTNRYPDDNYYSYQPQQQNRFQALRDTERSTHRNTHSGQQEQQNRFQLFRNLEKDDSSQRAAALKFDFNKALLEATKGERKNSSELSSDEAAVVSDMKQWQASGQWLFTSYGPFGNSASYPAFCDISMEELRLDYYNAFQAGAVADYASRVKQAAINVQQNIQHLLSMTPDVKTCLKNLRNDQATAGPPSSFITASSSLQQPSAALTTAPAPFTSQTQLQVSAQQSMRPLNPSSTPKVTKADYVYSTVERLSPEEKEQFLAEHFTLGKIPLRAPPKEYCSVP